MDRCLCGGKFSDKSTNVRTVTGIASNKKSSEFIWNIEIYHNFPYVGRGRGVLVVVAIVAVVVVLDTREALENIENH